MALPLAAFLSDVLEPRIRASAVAGNGQPIRVALFRGDSSPLLAFTDALFRALSFNGKSALENGSDYREFVVDEAAGNDRTKLAGLLSATADFAPHVVFYGGVDTQLVLESIERAWPKNRGFRPIYVSGDAIAANELGFVGKDAERRHRVFGITTVSNTQTNARLVMRFNQVFGEHATRTISPNTAYDAFYVLAYAVYAQGGSPVSGIGLARSIERLLPPGKRLEVGPMHIFEGYDELRAGRSIDLAGSASDLDFDPSTGDVPVDDVILCVGLAGKRPESVESGLVFDAKARRLVGRFGCP